MNLEEKDTTRMAGTAQGLREALQPLPPGFPIQGAEEQEEKKQTASAEPIAASSPPPCRQFRSRYQKPEYGQRFR